MASPPGKKDSCAILFVLAGCLIGLGWFLNSAAGWLV
jgi:hypothetical protein